MKKFLAVGLNHFARPGNDLAGCVADAQDMEKVAKSLGIDQPKDQIMNLTDSSVRKANVIHNFTELVYEAKAGKLSYLGFSWSGHGTHYPNLDEDDGLGEALVCYDIREKDGDWDRDTIITDQELKDLLNQVPAACRVEVWLDTCYSGGMDRILRPGAAGRFLHNPGNAAGEMRVSNLSMTQGLNSNIVMWCASSEGQTSADAYIKDGYHGAFTYAWVQAYKAYPKDSRVSLLLRARKWLADNYFDQFPRLKSWNKPAQELVGR